MRPHHQISINVYPGRKQTTPNNRHSIDRQSGSGKLMLASVRSPSYRSSAVACLISSSWRHLHCTQKWFLRVHQHITVTSYGSQSARRGQQCTGRIGPAPAPTPAVHHTQGRWWTTVTSHNARTGSDQTDTTRTTCVQCQ